MDVYLRKIGPDTWAAANDKSREDLAPFKIGEIHKAYVGKKRSLPEHNLFFAFITFCFEQQEYYRTMEDFRTNLFMRIEYGTWQYARVGEEKIKIFIPGSVAFHNCSQQRFHEMFSNAISYINEKMGIDLEQWKRNQVANSPGHFRYWDGFT